MKRKFSQIVLSAAFCCTPLLVSAQQPVCEGQRMEAEYLNVCQAYELQHPQAEKKLLAYLDKYPDSPHTDRLYALVASTYFFQQDYNRALAYYQAANLEVLPNHERDDMTFRLATCYLKTGNLKEAAAWFETLKSITQRYDTDCTYYLSYIRYTQGLYNEALKGFLSLRQDTRYGKLILPYLAEIYLQKKQYAQAEQQATEALSAPGMKTAQQAELKRIIGCAQYYQQNYLAAMKSFQTYVAETKESPRRDALYAYGLACYYCQAYSQVPELLNAVAQGTDELAQNAWYHIGLAYLQLADQNKARMAFEQAANLSANTHLREEAAYYHALCVYETSYSAFGESVTVLEKFLNEYPQSRHFDEASRYLVDVYMTTRSYQAALNSIERIARPGATILEAKQKILFQLGTQDFTNALFKEAAERFSQSLALGQYNAQTRANAYFWRGEAYYRLNLQTEATADFTQFLALAPQQQCDMRALAHYNLGYLAFHTKQYTSARSHFLQFLQLQSPNHPTLLADACNRLGDCYLEGRHFQEARHYYTQAENYGTASGDYSFYQLALVAGLQKDYAGKVTLLNQLAVKYPQSAYVVHALYEKGRSYVQDNRTTEAISTFRELLKKYPESPLSRKAAAEIGLLYYQLEDYPRAIEAYKWVVKEFPGSAEARLAMRDLKSIYVDANRVDEFAALAASLPGGISFEPSEQDSLTYIAAERIYMKGQKNQARQSLERYLQTFPEGSFSLNARYYICVIAKEQHDKATVLEQSGKLLEFPDNPYSEEALLMHAEILFNQQQYAEAMADYKQLVAKTATSERRQLGQLGVLRCAKLSKDDVEVIHAATALLSEAKLSPEWRNEALYDRAIAYLTQQAPEKAMSDLQLLAQDTRTLYGAEAKYRVAQLMYNAKNYPAAEKEILNFIDQSTPHAYWLARSFVLLSDVYVAMDKKLDARQYLLSLQQNYQAEDDIAGMIEERLKKLNNVK